ncbi:MAG TPA: hypothetical protein ENJ95_19115 [Bacteroidetes bacterium]|nr:hypothetical protein [Bacteroidota bacterium]
MKKSIIFFAFFFTSFFSFSQNETAGKKPSFTPSFRASIGGLLLNYDQLNNVLEDNYIATFDGPALNASFVFAKTWNTKKPFGSYIGLDFLEGFESGKKSLNPNNNSLNARALKGYGLLVGTQYMALRKKYFQLYPSLGVGINRTTFTVFEQIPGGFSLSSTLNSNLVTRKYSSWNTFYDLGINAETRIPLLATIFNIGINAGYRLGPKSNNWNYEDAVNVNFPELSLSGFHFAFVVGYEFSAKRYSDYFDKRKNKKKKG